MPNQPKKFKILNVDCEILAIENSDECTLQGSYNNGSGPVNVDPVSFNCSSGNTQQIDKRTSKAIAEIVKSLEDEISNTPKDPQEGYDRVYWFLHNKVS